MLLVQNSAPCLFALQKYHGRSCWRYRPAFCTKAAAQDDLPKPSVPRPQISWDEHISTQAQQADSYRPPVVKSQDIRASREKFLGRLAVLILGLEMSATEVPLWEIEPILGIIVLALCAAALWPSNVKKQEGKAKPGFLERMQNLSGRFACLGLASTIAAEVVTGKGALTLLNVETGLDSVSELEAIGAFVIMLLLTEDLSKDKKE